MNIQKGELDVKEISTQIWDPLLFCLRACFLGRVTRKWGRVRMIQEWLQQKGLPQLEVTNKKDLRMIEGWDDRAIQAVRNEGRFGEGS